MGLRKTSLIFLALYALCGVVFESIADTPSTPTQSLAKAQLEISELKHQNAELRVMLEAHRLNHPHNRTPHRKKRRHKHRSNPCKKQAEDFRGIISENHRQLYNCRTSLQACTCAATPNPNPLQCPSS